jgi:hypothetical protein
MKSMLTQDRGCN